MVFGAIPGVSNGSFFIILKETNYSFKVGLNGWKTHVCGNISREKWIEILLVPPCKLVNKSSDFNVIYKTISLILSIMLRFWGEIIFFLLKWDSYYST